MSERYAAAGFAIFEGPNIIRLTDSDTKVETFAVFPVRSDAEVVLSTLPETQRIRYKIFAIKIP